MKNSDYTVTISFSAKKKFIDLWGSEVLMKCSCGYIPSHTMWGQYGPGKCPVCNQKCETIHHEWGIIDGP